MGLFRKILKRILGRETLFKPKENLNPVQTAFDQFKKYRSKGFSILSSYRKASENLDISQKKDLLYEIRDIALKTRNHELIAIIDSEIRHLSQREKYRRH